MIYEHDIYNIEIALQFLASLLEFFFFYDRRHDWEGEVVTKNNIFLFIRCISKSYLCTGSSRDFDVECLHTVMTPPNTNETLRYRNIML